MIVAYVVIIVNVKYENNAVSTIIVQYALTFA